MLNGIGLNENEVINRPVWSILFNFSYFLATFILKVSLEISCIKNNN